MLLLHRRRRWMYEVVVVGSQASVSYEEGQVAGVICIFLHMRFIIILGRLIEGHTCCPFDPLPGFRSWGARRRKYIAIVPFVSCQAVVGSRDVSWLHKCRIAICIQPFIARTEYNGRRLDPGPLRGTFENEIETLGLTCG